MATLAFRFLSWNLKDFGNYDYSSTMSQIAQTIIESEADIVVILEAACGTSQKRSRIDETEALPGAQSAFNTLLAQLKKDDNASNWKGAISKVNATNAQRDAYIFYWRSTSGGGAADATHVFPTKITMKNPPSILRKDSAGKDLGFMGSRRPGACVFTIENNTAVPPTKDALVCGFHAYADFSDTAGIQRSIKDCLKATSAVAGKSNPALPAVIGGDLNIDYNSEKAFYQGLKTDPALGYDTALTAGAGSSLSSAPNFSVPSPVWVKNAYDNLLFKGCTLVPGLQAIVIDVVEKIAAKLPQEDGRGQKRPREETLAEAYKIYYPTNTGGGKTSCISDHFPVFGVFGF